MIMRYLLALTFSLLPCIPFADAWWELETQMNPDGKLLLIQKEWWPRALQLKTGEHFVLKSTYPEGGTMIIRREARTRTAKPQDMIVWILDDDGDLPAGASQGDTDSDCYIADYGCDGTVDRLVDYIDSNGDQIPDEMDIRYFEQGELRRAWFGVDLDGDGLMWDLADYEYTGDFFQSDPYGNNEIYMNKYNPRGGSWIPISECPFAFYDTDGDGQSEAVVRFSAAPLTFSPETDPDYANSQARYQGEYDPAMERMGVVNIRYSLDIDGLSSPENPLHYEMGFNLVGSLPYDFPGMRRTQPLRRAPKTTVCIPFPQAREVSGNYPAEQTGFSWREFEDGSIAIGHPSRPAYDRRWEGVFWTWNRRVMHNTGGPVQYWNMRREFMPGPSTRRQLYYSPVDRRLHLKGAVEGWVPVGCIESQEPLGEIRLFDTDRDGYFDRWEYFWEGEDAPCRVASVHNAENKDLTGDWASIMAFYNQQAVPEAIRLNEQLIAAIERQGNEFAPPVPANLTAALKQDISPDERRYILDWIREYRYWHFQKAAQARARQQLTAHLGQDPRASVELRKQSPSAWDRAVTLSRIDDAYARGLYDQVVEMMDTLKWE